MKTQIWSNTIMLMVLSIIMTMSPQALAAWNWYADGLNDTVKYNEAYWSRPHNTFENNKFSSLGDALNQGYRAVELDVFPKPGYEKIYVSHSYTSPTNNKCSGSKEFLDCLRDIKGWSDSNPNHDVITLQLDMKDFIISPMWNDRAHRLMVSNIESVFGSKLYKPKNLKSYTGYTSLREGVKNTGWPELGQLRGKIIVFGLAGPIGSKNQTQSRMIDTVGGDNMPLFICPEATAPEHFSASKYANGFSGSSYSHNNQWVICGNTSDGKYWATLAAEASKNNQLMAIWSGNENAFDPYDKMMQAVGWGATMISRETSTTYGNKIPLNGKRNSMPTHFMIQNVKSNLCVDVSGAGTSNGTSIVQWPCGGYGHQIFLYSDEFQLRALHHPSYCLDPEGKSVGNKRVLLWNCGTQKTQKWTLSGDNGGMLLQNSNQNYTMAVSAGSTAAGAEVLTYQRLGVPDQNWRLIPVESSFIDWRNY
ncbi:phosphatidylinositol-specific phospholipase C domain-containing protein [Photobacterium minamisatsumaniensis]|uniref:phosphatidylinositol-specific phospholipase C domain-containing protein n=1 Tax=Photobacterium minamisatsumaniensis TaxID=2910233 RepID=UPI003D14A678